MNSSNATLKEIFLTDDILPLGSFETIPVHSVRDALPESYPHVMLVRSGINYTELLNEAKVHMGIEGFNYVKPRIQHINKQIDETTLREVLSDVGFYKGSYQSFSIRKLGTNILEDWVMPATRNFFNSLQVNTFRQQYAVAAPGWNTKLHRDHRDFKVHGFRAMVPLSADVYMGYEGTHKENIVYKLTRGNMYFVNIAAMHRGFNESETVERINLIMQMDTDTFLLKGKEIAPLTDDDIKLLPAYASTYQNWSFGNEL